MNNIEQNIRFWDDHFSKYGLDYPNEQVVRFMANICENTEKYYDYEYRFDEAYVQDITTAIAHNVVESANILDVKAIVAATVRGIAFFKTFFFILLSLL